MASNPNTPSSASRPSLMLTTPQREEIHDVQHHIPRINGTQDRSTLHHRLSSYLAASYGDCFWTSAGRLLTLASAIYVLRDLTYLAKSASVKSAADASGFKAASEDTP